MRKNRSWTLEPIAAVFLLVTAAIIGLSPFWNYYVFAVQGVLFLSAVVFSAVYCYRFRKNLYRFYNDILHNIDPVRKENVDAYPLPVMVIDPYGKIVWYNRKIRGMLCKNAEIQGENIAGLVSGADAGAFEDGTLQDIRAFNKRFSVYANEFISGGTVYTMLFWHEDTELKNIADEYLISRPAVAVVLIDSYEELLKDTKEYEKAVILGQIESVLSNWAEQSTGFLRHIERDKYIFLFEKRHLNLFISKRFEVLEKIRTIKSSSNITATLSIGISCEAESLCKNEEAARQALDMALGRGGDQVVLKTASGFSFFGGVSRGIEKRTRVRTRMVAKSLGELIGNCDQVIIMGHKSSDLDCVGASIGLYKAAIDVGKGAYVVVQKRTSLASGLIRYAESSAKGMFIEPEEALEMMTPQTLLIIADTHRPEIFEAPLLVDKVKSVVVIDHHRKTVDFIDKTVIFYHEPNASSTCELVAELLQYMEGNGPSKMEAEALLAGIMLDTKNFSMRTGVRTFEAAAYLRRKGADTVAVKRFFSGSIKEYQKRSSIVSSANIYKNCAIAFWDGPVDSELRMIAPQAADDLLTIEGVDASYVLYQLDGNINISARSLGTMNVQLVMEALGGGGHQTMAGAQVKNSGLKEVIGKLIAAIDAYNRDLGE